MHQLLYEVLKLLWRDAVKEALKNNDALRDEIETKVRAALTAN